MTRAYLSVPVHAPRCVLAARRSCCTFPRPIARRRRPIPRRRAWVSSGASCSRAPPRLFDDDRRTRPARRGDAATVGPRHARAPPPDRARVRARPHPRARVGELAAAGFAIVLLAARQSLAADDVPEDDATVAGPRVQVFLPRRLPRAEIRAYERLVDDVSPVRLHGDVVRPAKVPPLRRESHVPVIPIPRRRGSLARRALRRRGFHHLPNVPQLDRLIFAVADEISPVPARVQVRDARAVAHQHAARTSQASRGRRPVIGTATDARARARARARSATVTAVTAAVTATVTAVTATVTAAVTAAITTAVFPDPRRSRVPHFDGGVVASGVHDVGVPSDIRPRHRVDVVGVRARASV